MTILAKVAAVPPHTNGSTFFASDFGGAFVPVAIVEKILLETIYCSRLKKMMGRKSTAADGCPFWRLVVMRIMPE